MCSGKTSSTLRPHRALQKLGDFPGKTMLVQLILGAIEATTRDTESALHKLIFG